MRRKLLWLIVLDVIILVLAAAAQEPVKPLGEYGPQVVFVLDHQDGEHKYVVPRATVFFNLVPLAGPTAKAPLAKGDLLICRDFTMKDQEGGFHIGIKCGVDQYTVQGVGIQPPK